jgi:hypothetical protein
MAIGVVTVTGIFILILRDVVPASLGGLVLSYALQMAGVFQWSGKLQTVVPSFVLNHKTIYYPFL